MQLLAFLTVLSFGASPDIAARQENAPKIVCGDGSRPHFSTVPARGYHVLRQPAGGVLQQCVAYAAT
eukprot:SAG11_NODE_29397_length_311_cov_0.764151_1_plen_66_part_01